MRILGLMLIAFMCLGCEEPKGADSIEKLVRRIERAIQKDKLEDLKSITDSGEEIPVWDSRRRIIRVAKGMTLKHHEFVRYEEAKKKWPDLLGGRSVMGASEMVLYLLWQGVSHEGREMKVEQYYHVVMRDGRYFLRIE